MSKIRIFKWWSKLIVPYKFITGGVIITIIMVVYAILIHNINLDYVTSGQFGDQFGVVNTFFSAMAFMGILISLFNTIEDRKNDLKEKKREAFENRFFLLLQNLDRKTRLTSELEISKYNQNYTITKDYHTQSYTILKCLSDYIIDHEFDTVETPKYLKEYFEYQFYITLINNVEFWNKYRKSCRSNFSSDLIKSLSIDIRLKCMSDYTAFISISEFLNKEYEMRLKSMLDNQDSELEKEMKIYIDLIKSITNYSAIALYFYLYTEDNGKYISKPVFNIMFSEIKKGVFLCEEHYTSLKDSILQQS